MSMVWDALTLIWRHCHLFPAGHCDDPGTPAGATQTVTSDGYVQGATVTLSCDRTTFVFPETGTNTVTLTCLPGPGGTSVWSDTVTECIGKLVGNYIFVRFYVRLREPKKTRIVIIPASLSLVAPQDVINDNFRCHQLRQSWHYYNSCISVCNYCFCVMNDKTKVALLWRHNGRDGVSNHQPHDCLLNRLFRRRSKKTPKLRVTGFCAGNSPVTGEFPAQRASNAENVSIWWRHHGYDTARSRSTAVM